MKMNYKLTKLIIAVIAIATLCACFKPAVPVDSSVEVVEETVVEEPAPVVEKPEVEEPETSEPEIIKEESNEPELVLYDDNGDFYVPQKVTLDEFYARIDYANQKYAWKSDWDRDRFVGLLLYLNAYGMKDGDIKTVYEDYLDNFGFDMLDEQSVTFDAYFEDLAADNHFHEHSYIDLDDLFVDAKLASEAKKYQAVISDRQKNADYNNKKRSYVESLDFTDEGMYTILFEVEISNIMYSCDKKVADDVLDNAHVIMDSKQKIMNQINVDEETFGDYNTSGYESSHVEMTK